MRLQLLSRCEVVLRSIENLKKKALKLCNRWFNNSGRDQQYTQARATCETASSIRMP